MDQPESWLDKTMRRICEWFDDFFPGNHAVVTVGDGLAGLTSPMPMPVDRTWRPSTTLFTKGNVTAMANKAHIGTGHAAPETSCNFWAYCHIDGNLCVWCGGKNSLWPPNPAHRDMALAGPVLCPSGSVNGSAWYGCCRNPVTKVAKYIAFMDCCGLKEEDCGPGKPECEKWPQAKNWCDVGDSPKEYYCTVVIDQGWDNLCRK